MTSHTTEIREQDHVLYVSIDGIFDETVDLEGMVAEKSVQEVRFDLGKVKRINSSGVRKWLLFLQNKKEAFRIRLGAVPPCVVEQMNLIAGFLDGVQVESIFLPYVCNRCDHEHLEQVEASEFEKLKTELPVVACTQCDNPEMEFDYLPEEYLYFLSQST